MTVNDHQIISFVVCVKEVCWAQLISSLTNVHIKKGERRKAPQLLDHPPPAALAACTLPPLAFWLALALGQSAVTVADAGTQLSQTEREVAAPGWARVGPELELKVSRKGKRGINSLWGSQLSRWEGQVVWEGRGLHSHTTYHAVLLLLQVLVFK